MHRTPAHALMLLLALVLAMPACFFGPAAIGNASRGQLMAHSHHAGQSHYTGHGETDHNTPVSPQAPVPASMPDFCAIACVTLAAAPGVFHGPDWPDGQRLLFPPTPSASPRAADRIERPPRRFS